MMPYILLMHRIRLANSRGLFLILFNRLSTNVSP